MTIRVVAVLVFVALVPACKGSLNQRHVGDAAADVGDVGVDGPLAQDSGAVDLGMTTDVVPVDVNVPEDVGPDTTVGAGELGLPCALGGECASGFCVDGVCCESACSGSCEACGEPDMKGQCVATMGTPRPNHRACAGVGTPCLGMCDGASRAVCSYPATTTSCRPAGCTAGTATLAATCDGKGACPTAETVDCAPNACAGTICAGGCSDASPCAGAMYCAAGKCVAKKASGQTCAAASECTSGFCADGYCCNSACATACNACNLTGLLGTCSPVKSGVDDTCSGMSSCDAKGLCNKANGQTCTGATDCTSGNCVDGHCCGTASCGACQACTGGGGTCVAVNNAEDADTCSGTKSCDAMAMCKLKAGQVCTTANQCNSGFCADGVCCNAACTGACEACGEATSKGTCIAVTAAPRAGHPACTGAGTACGGSCDGTNRTMCGYPATSCRAASCTAGVATLAASCDGKGACPAAQTVNCAPNTCSGTTCAGGCSASQPCTGTNYCSAGVCVPKKANGSPCNNDPGECTGTCVDNVCCSVASCGTCQACSGAGGTCVAIKNADDPNSCTVATSTCDATGACKKKQGQVCSVNADCATGACADGVCCNVACGGQCQACNEPTKVGTCSRITGAPRAGHTACTTTPATCAGSCSGSSDTCTYPGSGTSCTSASCSADLSTASSATACNSAGACSTPQTTNCGTMGAYCNGGACAPKVGNGGGCTKNIQCTTANCSTDTCCASGLTACSGTCYDLTNGPGHCGSCNITCTTGQSCMAGTCKCAQKGSWNLLLNPGFDGASNWDLGSGPVKYNSMVDVNGCNGSGAMEFQNFTDTLTQTKAALKNTTYYYGYRATGDGGTFACGMDFNAGEFGSRVFTNPDSSWTSGSGSVTLDDTATTWSFVCYAQGAHMYVDEVYVTTDATHKRF